MFSLRIASRVNTVALFNKVQPLRLAATAGFIERNEQLKRPTSPHMLIYAWPITSLTSGSHRATGALMSLAIYGLGGAMFAASGHSTDIVNYIADLQINPVLFMGMKALFVWPLCYHTVNGFRHFVWDFGYGYEKKTFTVVGLSVVATSIGLAFLVANLKPKCDKEKDAVIEEITNEAELKL